MQDDSTPPVATAKATPGPWRAHQHAKGFWRIRGAPGPYFAEVDTEPDARLIAAAPALLAALEDAFTVIGEGLLLLEQEEISTEDFTDEMAGLQEQTRAVIAQAKVAS